MLLYNLFQNEKNVWRSAKQNFTRRWWSLPAYLSVCLFVCLSVCLSLCLFVCLSVYLSICLSVYLFIPHMGTDNGVTETARHMTNDIYYKKTMQDDLDVDLC